MFVPKLLDQVRVKDRPEVFMVFRLDRAQQTADLFCPTSGLVERGVRWTMLEDAWDDRGQPGSFCKPLPPRQFPAAPLYSSISQKHPW
jgi:hypothetical protein